VGWLTALWRRLVSLVQDLASSPDRLEADSGVQDDVLDAAHDEDGMDATGL
jgi:hypothetical protein